MTFLRVSTKFRELWHYHLLPRPNTLVLDSDATTRFQHGGPFLQPPGFCGLFFTFWFMIVIRLVVAIVSIFLLILWRPTSALVIVRRFFLFRRKSPVFAVVVFIVKIFVLLPRRGTRAAFFVRIVDICPESGPNRPLFYFCFCWDWRLNISNRMLPSLKECCARSLYWRPFLPATSAAWTSRSEPPALQDPDFLWLLQDPCLSEACVREMLNLKSTDANNSLVVTFMVDLWRHPVEQTMTPMITAFDF